jgi:peptide deformylase
MIYPIVKFGNPVLDKPAEKVTVFDEELEKLVDDMFESMYAAHGVGLAAPQIGISRRIAVVDGKLYISHISALKRDLMKRKIRKLVKAGEW